MKSKWLLGLMMTALVLAGCTTTESRVSSGGGTVTPLDEVSSASSTADEVLSAPPEKSPVYESKSLDTQPGSKSGGKSGWGVPEKPAEGLIPKEGPPSLRDAQPDVGVVRTEPSMTSSQEEYSRLSSTDPFGSSAESRGGSPEPVLGGDLPGPVSGDTSGLSRSLSLPSADPFAPLEKGVPSLSGEKIAMADPFAPLALGGSTSLPAPPISAAPTARGVERGGQPAPVFSATTMAGASFDLASCRGRVVLLDFWFSTCGPCLRAMQKVAELRKTYPETQLLILGLNTDPTQSAADRHLRQNPHNWPQIYVPSQRINLRKAYGVNLYPTFVVIDQVGNTQYRGSDVNQAAAKVAELVASPSVPGTQLSAGYMASLN